MDENLSPLFAAPLNDDIAEADSIFQQPWWLEAVTAGSWGEVSISSGGRISARLPYVIKRKYGLTLVTMPRLTPTLGPWFRQSEGKYTNQLAERKDLCEQLISGLPHFDVFLQTFSPSMTNVLPFQWAGFRASVSYTYRLDDLSDIEATWEGLRGTVRTDIRKAERSLTISCEPDLERLIDLNHKTFARQGIPVPHAEQLVRTIDAACARHEARRIFFARDDQGRFHAGLYLVWDKNTSYYLMGGGDVELRNSGAMSLLIWEAIKFSARASRSFDFEGSMLEPIERFFRAFGARQTLCFEVSRLSRRAQFLVSGRQMLAAMLGRPQGHWQI